jgi:hypothetical protein
MQLSSPAASVWICCEDSRRSGTVPHSVRGCHVAHPHTVSAWWLDRTPFDASQFGADDDDDDDDDHDHDDDHTKDHVSLPDLVLDPETHVLSLLNARDDVVRAFTLSIERFVCIGRDERELESVLDEAARLRCTTFVVLLAPRTVVDVCRVVVPRGELLESVQLFSDVRELALADYDERPIDVAQLDFASVRRRVLLPLDDAGGGASFLCSQGCGGQFTHFLPQTRYAIDLECAVGTPVRSVADGVVREVKCDVTARGAHTLNLWQYNIVIVEHDDGTFADFVHVRAHSAVVRVGERVRAGQQLCESGDVGFCPVPHLHFQLAESGANDALPVPFVFRADDDASKLFLPMAGQRCNTSGLAL